MTITQGKAIFLWGTALSAVIFLALTYDSLSRCPEERTKKSSLPRLIESR